MAYIDLYSKLKDFHTALTFLILASQQSQFQAHAFLFSQDSIIMYLPRATNFSPPTLVSMPFSYLSTSPVARMSFASHFPFNCNLYFPQPCSCHTQFSISNGGEIHRLEDFSCPDAIVFAIIILENRNEQFDRTLSPSWSLSIIDYHHWMSTTNFEIEKAHCQCSQVIISKASFSLPAHKQTQPNVTEWKY